MTWLTKRDRKFLGLALAVSSRSTYSRVKIGAVLVRDGKVLASAANLCTSHPMQALYNIRAKRKAPQHNLHAEMHALVRATVSVKGAEMYVGRFDRRGNLAMCKPCPACALALKTLGVTRVVYTSPNGIMQIEENNL